MTGDRLLHPPKTGEITTYKSPAGAGTETRTLKQRDRAPAGSQPPVNSFWLVNAHWVDLVIWLPVTSSVVRVFLNECRVPRSLILLQAARASSLISCRFLFTHHSPELAHVPENTPNTTTSCRNAMFTRESYILTAKMLNLKKSKSMQTFLSADIVGDLRPGHGGDWNPSGRNGKFFFLLFSKRPQEN